MAMRSSGGGRRWATIGMAVVVAVVVAACAPPTSPPPAVLPPGPGQGTVPGGGVVPSIGCLLAAPIGLPAGRTHLQVPWQGGTRAADVDVPAGDGGPHPLVLSLHPFALDATAWDAYSGLSAAGTARGYVVVTPFGSDPGPRWAVPGGLDTGVDDIGFLNRLLDEVETRACIDRNRVFAAGFSAGAAMAQALGCTLPWRLAAVAGSGGTNLTDLCPDSPGIDVMVLHGTADPIVPVTGSTAPFATPLGLPVDNVVATNAARAGCSPVPLSTLRSPSVLVDTYQGCTERRRVEYWRMLGTGHTWAGQPSLIDIVAGPTNTEFSATEAVLDFFDADAG
jgi:polyhydroxybutyrate depolymerase